MSTKKKDAQTAFIDKFKNQIESIGKDGIIGLMKSAHLSISKTDPGLNPLEKWNKLYKGASQPNSIYAL